MPVDLTDVLVVGSRNRANPPTPTRYGGRPRARRGDCGITNEPEGSMARDGRISRCWCKPGPEESVAATKTYTCQLLALYLLACALGGEVSLDLLRQLPAWVAEVWTWRSGWVKSPSVHVHEPRGHGGAGPELRECAGVRPQTDGDLLRGDGAFSRADLMHGPIAVVDRAFPVFVFAPGGVTWPSTAMVLDRLEELKAEILVITDEGNVEAAAKPARLIQLPMRHPFCEGPRDLYTPIPYIVPAQLFAAQLAVLKGVNPDRPRTIEKITRTM